MKFRTWRRLWIALAEAEKELGLDITQEQIDELIEHKDDINYDVAKARVYNAVQVAFGSKKPSRVSKPLKGQFEKAGIPAPAAT